MVHTSCFSPTSQPPPWFRPSKDCGTSLPTGLLASIPFSDPTLLIRIRLLYSAVYASCGSKCMTYVHSFNPYTSCGQSPYLTPWLPAVLRIESKLHMLLLNDRTPPSRLLSPFFLFTPFKPTTLPSFSSQVFAGPLPSVLSPNSSYD